MREREVGYCLGADSATITSNFRFRAANLKNSSTVRDLPNVIITSLNRSDHDSESSYCQKHQQTITDNDNNKAK
jgi:hypothetical protein